MTGWQSLLGIRHLPDPDLWTRCCMQGVTSRYKRDGGRAGTKCLWFACHHVLLLHIGTLDMHHLFHCIPTMIRKLSSSANMDSDRLLHCGIDIVLSRSIDRCPAMHNDSKAAPRELLPRSPLHRPPELYFSHRRYPPEQPCPRLLLDSEHRSRDRETHRKRSTSRAHPSLPDPKRRWVEGRHQPWP